MSLSCCLHFLIFNQMSSNFFETPCIILFIFNDVNNFKLNDVINVYDIMQIITNALEIF